MKKNEVVTRLVKGAVMTALASNTVGDGYTVNAVPQGTVAQDVAVNNSAEVSNQIAGGAFNFTITEHEYSWSHAQEREFHKLLAAEASGSIQPEQLLRLEELNAYRNRFRNPMPAESILLQLRRDRLVEKTAELLKEYVEFEKIANQTRRAA
jgi:hypothetical protein